MKKIEAIIRPAKLDEIKRVIDQHRLTGLTVTQVIGCGKQKGHTQVYRGMEYTVFLIPKIKIELVVQDEYLDQVVAAISQIARTGEVGDGKIFVTPVENAIRIRTGEQGNAALG